MSDVQPLFEALLMVPLLLYLLLGFGYSIVDRLLTATFTDFKHACGFKLTGHPWTFNCVCCISEKCHL